LQAKPKGVQWNKILEYVLGLMERKSDDGTHRALAGWESFNKYYDENVIEEFVNYTTRRFRA
jgi:hypothetical protein